MTTDIISVRTREEWWLDTFNKALEGVIAGIPQTVALANIIPDAALLARDIANQVHGVQNPEVTELP